MSSLTEIIDTANLRYLTLVQDEYIYPSLKNYGQYAEEEMELLSLFLDEDSLILDVGANIGTHSLNLAKKIPRGEIWAFEPQQFIFQILSGNVALNSLTNIRTFHCAVGKENEQITIPKLDYKSLNNFGGLELHNSGDKEKEDYDLVPMITLDSLELDFVSLIKIDVEGMEEEVLRGAFKTIFRSRPVLYVEADRGQKRTALISFLGTLGYRIWEHKPFMVKGEPLVNSENAQVQNLKKYQAINFICLPKEIEPLSKEIVERFQLRVVS